MKLFVSGRSQSKIRQHKSAGWTLIEVVVASGLGAIFLVGVVLTTITSLRNFAGMYNYTDMSISSRLAMDEIARSIRTSRGVSLSGNVLTVTNSGGNTTYTWDPTDETLDRDIANDTTTLLTHVSSWQAAFYQRAPTLDYDNNTNASPAGDNTKLISMEWRCYRTVMGLKLNTEIVQEARIVLRNEAQH